jgi:hypothetical protein
MSTLNKSVQYSIPVKMKWWYMPMLILGSVMFIGGIVWVVVQ